MYLLDFERKKPRKWNAAARLLDSANVVLIPVND
jgi:hypothetical protein